MSVMLPIRLHSPNSSLKAPSVRNSELRRRNGGVLRAVLCGALAGSNGLRFGRTRIAENREDDFGALGSLPPRIPSSTRGHASGPFRRPAARRRSASLRSVPPRTSLKTAAKNAAQTSSGPRQESTPWHLGAGPTRSLREG